MIKVKIKLVTVEEVKSFFTVINQIKSDAIIRSEDRKYAVDAKSLLGIFSLDLTKNLILEINDEEKWIIDKIKDINVLIEE